MTMQMTGGVGATNVTYYETITVHLDIADHAGQPVNRISFQTHAGFTAGMDAQGIGLLGQLGFFETFTVLFNHRLKIFTIDA